MALAATGGALWTISRTDGLPLWGAAKMFFRSVTIALVFTGMAAHYASGLLGFGTQELISPVAFVIAWIGDGWIALRDRGLQTLTGLLNWRKSS